MALWGGGGGPLAYETELPGLEADEGQRERLLRPLDPQPEDQGGVQKGREQIDGPRRRRLAAGRRLLGVAVVRDPSSQPLELWVASEPSVQDRQEAVAEGR